MTGFDPELLNCPPTREFCPFLNDCVVAEQGALAERQQVFGDYLELTAGRAEDEVQTDLAQQLGTELLPETEGDDHRLLGRLMGELSRGADQTNRAADDYEQSLTRLAEMYEQQATQARTLADQTREHCPGGPETRKRWGRFGREMLVCADPRNQSIKYDKPAEL